LGSQGEGPPHFNDHVHTIRCHIHFNGTEVDPTLPEDNDEVVKWRKSEQVALGLMIRSATNFHSDLCHAHERGRAWDLWCTIMSSRMYELTLQGLDDAFRYSQETRGIVLRHVPLYRRHAQPDHLCCSSRPLQRAAVDETSIFTVFHALWMISFITTLLPRRTSLSGTPISSSYTMTGML
jgi:hypothetical protein